MTTVDSGSSGTSNIQRRYKFRESVQTDIGLRRNENQDAYGIAHTSGTSLFIVADGMGGARGGATASAMAVHVIINEAIKQNGMITRPSLKSAIEQANAAIYSRSKEDEDLNGMGTTVVALAFVNECAIVAHVGDSRIYRLRDGELEQLTHDHTLVQELVDSGAIPKEDAENHPIAHMLTRSLGPAAQVEVEIQALVDPTQVGDKFLLCSDGLYNLVTDEEIAQHLRDEDPKEASAKLIALALERGGTDNVTVEILEVCDLTDESCTEEYPPEGELRFVFSEGVTAPELRSIIASLEESPDFELNGDTMRDLPAMGDDDLEPAVEDTLDLDVIGDEVAAKNQDAQIVAQSDSSKSASGSRLRMQASAFFVVGLTAGIFGFFLYQYSGVHQVPAGAGKKAVVNPDGELAQDLGSLQTPEASYAPEILDTLPSEIPSMRDAEGESPTRAAKQEFLNALRVPDAPYVQVRDPEVAGMQATRPIVWENEAQKVNQILDTAAQQQAVKGSEAVEAPSARLLTSEERRASVSEKRALRDRLSDIDSKLRVLAVPGKEQAVALAREVAQKAEEKSEAIVELRRLVDEMSNEAAMWNSRSDLARGRSAVRLAEELKDEYPELQPVFESFTRASESYADAVEKWQAEPNDVTLATTMGASGRELQQARIALEQRLSEFVAKRQVTIGAEIADLRLKEDFFTIERDQLSRFEGYLKGYTELNASRRKELRDSYYQERGEFAAQLRELRAQVSDPQEVDILLEEYRPNLAPISERAQQPGASESSAG